jgi:hypothetical protein
VVAVVVLHTEIVRNELKIEGSGELGASDKARACDLVLADLRRIGTDSQLQLYEIPRMLIIEAHPFTADNHKLTPNLKINRPFLTRSYRAALLGNALLLRRVFLTFLMQNCAVYQRIQVCFQSTS